MKNIFISLLRYCKNACDDLLHPFPPPLPEDYEYVYGCQYQFSHDLCSTDRYGKKLQEGYIFRKHKITGIWEVQSSRKNEWRLADWYEIEYAENALKGKRIATVYYEKAPQ